MRIATELGLEYPDNVLAFKLLRSVNLSVAAQERKFMSCHVKNCVNLLTWLLIG